MIKKLFLLPLFLNFLILHAQTVKTDVLVVGAGPGAVATAIQSARSNVKTALIIDDSRLFAYSSAQNGTIQNNLSIQSGFWGEFRDSLVKHHNKTRGVDTAKSKPVHFETDVAEAIIKTIIDSVKNLTVYLNTGFTTIKKDGDRWEVTVSKNKNLGKILARVVVDATRDRKISFLLNLKQPDRFAAFDKGKPLLYRTSIATGVEIDDKIPGTNANIWEIPLDAVIVKGADNLLTTRLLPAAYNDIQLLPFQLQVGQGAGAIAAFCAFYKTTTKKLRVRLIQGELLNFKAYLLPFTDIAPNDPNWRSIQQVAATGLLKGVEVDGLFLFKPDSLVSTSEVKPVLTEIYTRAFLWFNKENTNEKFTLGNLLSFISDYTLTDPELLNSTMQKAWKSQYNFKQKFDLNRPVSRLEFAVLANKYLNPFARMIDLDGKLVN